MSKTLELQFTNEGGFTTNISLDSPVEPVDPVAVGAAMDHIIQADVFHSSYGKLVGIKGARLVERKVTEYEI